MFCQHFSFSLKQSHFLGTTYWPSLPRWRAAKTPWKWMTCATRSLATMELELHRLTELLQEVSSHQAGRHRFLVELFFVPSKNSNVGTGDPKQRTTLKKVTMSELIRYSGFFFRGPFVRSGPTVGELSWIGYLEDGPPGRTEIYVVNNPMEWSFCGTPLRIGLDWTPSKWLKIMAYDIGVILTIYWDDPPITLTEANMAPGNRWLEDEFPSRK